jgi:DNA-binding CsgD family transcriptional regulator
MNSGVHALSEREKETLRLLLRGHDAKSIAVEQNLSVHTVNERLRDARRKIGVSSSREAARRLAEVEETPENLGDKQLGVAGQPLPGLSRKGAVTPGSWLIGGTLVVSLIIAAVLLSSTLTASEGTAPAAIPAAVRASETAVQSPAAAAARSWLLLVDAKRWEESWKQAGTLFQAQIGAEGWSAAVQPVRKQVGTLVSRKLKSATKHNSLPGAPAGEYEIVEFDTSFSTASSTVETVVLARESSGWKAIGYFVRPSAG